MHLFNLFPRCYQSNDDHVFWYNEYFSFLQAPYNSFSSKYFCRILPIPFSSIYLSFMEEPSIFSFLQVSSTSIFFHLFFIMVPFNFVSVFCFLFSVYIFEGSFHFHFLPSSFDIWRFLQISFSSIYSLFMQVSFHFFHFFLLVFIFAGFFQFHFLTSIF